MTSYFRPILGRRVSGAFSTFWSGSALIFVVGLRLKRPGGSWAVLGLEEGELFGFGLLFAMVLLGEDGVGLGHGPWV